MKSISTNSFFNLIILILISFLTFTSLQAQVPGKSLAFDGVNDYLELGGDNDFGAVSNFTGAFTFEAWVLNDGTSTWGRVFDFGDSTNDYIFFTPNANSGECRFEFRTGGSTKFLIDGGIFPSGWTHVTCRLSASGEASILLDGNLVASATGWPSINNIFGTTRNYLGKSQFPNPYFKGKLKEVRVWKEHRNEALINEWMDCEISGTEPNLIGYFKLNDGLVGENNNAHDYYTENFGFLSRADGALKNFALTGSNSNWVGNSPWTEDATQQNVVEFHTRGDHFLLENESAFDFEDEYTIEYWMFPNFNWPAFQLPMIKGTTGSKMSFYSDHIDGKVFFGQRNSAGYHYWITAYGLQYNRWTHITLTAKEENGGLTTKIFFDGVEMATRFEPNYQIPQTNEQVKVGGDFWGKMANVRFWDKALDQAVIAKNISTIYPPGTPNLISQYVKYDNYALGLVDNIGNNTGVRKATPAFTGDPCFVQFIQEPQDIQLANFGEGINLATDLRFCNDSYYSYQWQLDGVDIPGETFLTLSVPSPNINNLGKYKCVVTACGRTFPTREAEVTIANQGKVLHFDGVDDYVSFSDLTGNSGFTVEARVRFDTKPYNQNIICNSTEGSDELYNQLAISKDGFFQHNSFVIGTEEMRSVKHPLLIEAHKWYNVELHYNGVHQWIEVEDVESAKLPRVGFTPVIPDWNIGKTVSTFQPFKGEIDEVRIWTINTSTIVSEATVEADADLKHYFQFNEGIAKADNTTPILVNSMQDPHTGATATLHNFDLSGPTSNWLGCDIYDGNISISMTSRKQITLGNELIIELTIDNADGSETYQWYKNDVAITGANSLVYSVPSSKLTDEGRYVLEVSRFNACTTFSSPVDVFIKGTGEVLRFDGVNDYMKIPSAAYVPGYTVEAWIKFTDDVKNQNIIVGSSTSGPLNEHSNQLYTDEDGYLSHRTYVEGNNTTIFMKALMPAVSNEWYHVVIRASNNANGAQLLINGVEQESQATGANLWSEQDAWYVGAESITYLPMSNTTIKRNFFKGEMDELRIWNSWRSTANILLEKDQEIQSTGLTGMTHYFKMNRGLANGNNQDLDISSQPNYGTNLLNPVPVWADAKMFNFAMSGSTSNFTECSPITIPDLKYGVTGKTPHIGNPLNINLTVKTGDTAQLNFQWLLDGTEISGATEPLYSVENMAIEDFGQYEVIVSDMCSPPYIDTLLVDSSPQSNLCFIGNSTNPIDYPTTKRYTFCTNQESQGMLCNSAPFYSTGSQINGGYCNSDLEYLGPEIGFHIPLTEAQVVDFTLSNVNADVDMWLFSDDCNIDNCVASSTNLFSEGEFIRAALPAGDYYLMIDQKEFFDQGGGNDSLILDIEMYDTKCSLSEQISCGDEVSSTTADGTNFIDAYDSNVGYTSSEKVYAITVVEPTTLNASLFNLSVDLDLFLLDSLCNEINLLIGSTQTGTDNDVISYGIQAGTYYIIVDGKEGVTGTFDLAISCANYFDASIDETDAYIDLEWSIDKKACVPQDTGIIVRLITTPNTILFEKEYTTAALTPDVITGDFRHLVGTDHSRMYVLRVYNRLSDKTICEEVKTGSTLPFQQPEILSISQAEAPDSIRIEWRNHSQLSEEFRIFRDGNQIASLSDGYTEDSIIVSYVDRHDMNISSSIDEASTYNYCIETFSTSLGIAYAQVCGSGSTYDIDFQATDSGTTDMVSLTWNDVSAFSDGIIISRNGIQQKILSPNETFYNDLSPIYGVQSLYKMTIIRKGDEKIMVTDHGFIDANGSVSGRVVYAEGGYPVQNATLTLSKDTLIQNVLTRLEIGNTSTDFEGKFGFTGVVYGLSSDFNVVATKAGSDFSPIEVNFELNSSIPAKDDILFTDNADVIVNASALLDTLHLDIQNLQDIVIVNWDYTYSPTETMHYVLKRNGVIIFEGNDSGGIINSFTDKSGVPGFNYNYSLDIFRYVGSDIVNEVKTVSGIYPSLTPVQGFNYTLDGQTNNMTNEMVGPRITFDWSAVNHPSQNFDGFRIFRNNILIGEIPASSSEMYSVIVPPAIEAGYEMRTFRKINGATYESTPFPSTADTLITALPLWEPVLLDNSLGFPPLSDRAIVLDIDPFATPVEYYENGIYTGVLLERKLQSAHDSTYVEVDNLTKQFIDAQASAQQKPQIWDAFGIPNANYTYKLSTYLDLNGTRYTRDHIFNRSCPAILAPTNLTKVEEIGKVGLSWMDNSVEEGLNSQLYFNYSGYELTRTDITNGGDPILIATIPGSTETYNDFLSNPVFNLFFNNYVHVDYNYELRAYFDIDSTRYYSSPLSINAAPLDGVTTEPLPTNFTASKNIPGHIKLCWDWFATKPSKFIIYRDTLAIDTLPTTARAYYDYDAPKDPSVIYKISSFFNGNESQTVLAEGRMPSNMNIHGRITNVISGAGLKGVNVIYRNQGNSGQGIQAGEFAGSTVTDTTGNYYFSDIPHTPGYKYQIKVFSNNVDFSESTSTFQSFNSVFVDITGERNYTIDFSEYSLPAASEIVTPIAAVTAVANLDSMFVDIAWSPVHGYYDGFQVYRVNQLIAEVKKGEGFNFKDKNGFPGINYVYTVRAYKSEVAGRKYSEHKAARATYPFILPVENLTVTAFTEMNQMLISWSHPLDNHDFYRVRRNGEFMALIPTREKLMWYDKTGIPGVVYQYEVTAIKGANISLPVVVEKSYKGVGEARSLALEIDNVTQACPGILTNDNHVTISWEYNAGAADGFEIYRDGGLIAEIDSVKLAFGNRPLLKGDVLMSGSVAFYDDYEGQPGLNHSYYVLPYVIRKGSRYASGIEELYLEESIVYPEIAHVLNLDIAQNNVLGAAEINFSYPPQIVNGFHILRDGIVIDTIVETHQGSYTSYDFQGLPGQFYTYAVRPYDARNGVTYFGNYDCNESIIFPIVPTPQNFSASQGTFENHIQVGWDFALEAFVDSFYLENLTLGTVKTFASGRRKFIDVVNDFSENKYEYRIRASRINQGQTIYSEWSPIKEGWSSRQVTGNEDNMITDDVLTSTNGFSVDIDGEWAVSGAPGGVEQISIYRRVNEGWSLFQSIMSPYENQDYDFGLSVAISGTTIVVGLPKTTNGSIAIYNLDGDKWSTIPQVLFSPGPGNFGWAVDIDGDDIIVGNPNWNNGSTLYGAIYWYKRNDNALWVNNGSIAGVTQLGNPDVARFGYGVAIDDGFSAASWTRPGANFNEVVAYVKNANNDWNFGGYFSLNQYTYTQSFLYDNIDYNDEILIIGDHAYNGSRGRVRIVELENNATVRSTQVDGTFGVNAHFGQSVAVKKIPSPIDEKIYFAVGAPAASTGITNVGKSLLYSNASGSFTIVDEIVNDNPATLDQNGWSVALSKETWASGIVRDNLMDNGSVTLKNLLKAPSKVKATDGISIDFDPTETTISWEFDGNHDLLAGFNIYRDEAFLTYRDKATMTLIGAGLYTDNWNDNSGEAGQPYVYAVKSVNNITPFESYGTSDEGFNRADGKIIGAVKTQMGLVPVPGVTITAKGIVAGEVYTYTTTTQPNGEYVFSSVFYDPMESVLTQYKITAEYLDHNIIPQTTDIAFLNPLNDPTQGVVDFFDVTAYVIKGNVSQPGVLCPLEGLKITKIINGVPSVGQEAYTDADGNYSLVVNPFEAGLQEISVSISDELTEDEVTTTYDFVASSDTTFTDFSSFPIVTELNYTDALTYNVSLKVKNTCNDAISTGKWRVRVRTLDGCFDQVFVTNSQGNLEVPLIPQNYALKVVGVDVPTSLNQQALDYFANFPVRLNLLDMHQDSIETLTKIEIEGFSARQFTFHKAAQIEVLGFNDIICNTQTAILQQGVPYTLSLNIFETHNGVNCPAQEGIVVVTNPAAKNSDPITIYYNDLLEKFDDYSFVTGGPNQIFPHAYAVTFDYKTVDGIFLGRKTRVVFVEGSVALPGTDILVDPASGNDAVPYPLLVLRDPPGDQSSSYIAAEQTISFETEMSIENETGAKLYTEVSAEFFGTGTEISANINAGFTTDKTISFENTVTTSTQISTSDDEDNIGRGADIIVGTGMVMQFGYILEFRVDEDECSKIQKVTKYGISPNAATTTWSYQVGQIEEIIQGYKNDSTKVEIGTLEIVRFGEPLTKEESIVFLNSNINNWTQVLRYHDVETVPYYYLCTLNPLAAGGPFHATQIGYWQAQIRPFFGSMVDGEFVLYDDIVWTDQLINIYNAASAGIRNLLQGGDLSIWSFPYIGDQSSVDLNVPLGSFNLVDIAYTLSQPSLTDYTSNFGAQVKNITTGGNVLIEESINNGQASSTSLSNSIYLGSELDIAVTFGGSSQIVVGTFAGVGGGVTFATVQELFETEYKVGASVETTFTRSNSYASTTEESVEVGYTIFDDDNTDAFSFAVIQAVTPNSTPYFDYFGGHSSCPPEDGSVFVDDPKLAILDVESGGTSQTKELFNVPADGPATFNLIAENQSPIASQPTRELEISLESGSNPNGAIVTLNGVSLNNSTYIDSFPVGEPLDLVLTIERGPTAYDYPDIQIGIEPTCGEGPREYIYASAYFVNPCSPVTLVAPIENWVINDDTSKLVVAMQDYDPENAFLVDATLQYRRIGAGQDWKDVPGLELERGNFIIADSLAANDEEYAEGQIPKYFFIWTIPTTEGNYPDGEYELRTEMICNNFSSTLSNVIKGKIARNGLNLFGNPQPADQIWTSGDEISFTFNKDLDCALITPSFINNNISVFNETTGQEEAFTLSCYANKVIFVMDNPMSNYDGQFLTINVDNIPSIEGNISLPHSWTFRVITQEIYWADADTIKLRMYQDDIQNLTIRLENSTLNQTISGLTLAAADGTFGDWLSITDPISEFSVNPSGLPIMMEIDASEPVGIYNETINVVGVAGNIPKVHIQLEVLVKPPNWVVDPGDFASSMNMIANWKYTIDPEGTKSTDVADLISVWVGNEIRGVAPITESGEFFASYLTIYGNPEDGNDTELEFRIWDADLGIEYDGHPNNAIIYLANSARGTTVNPEILNVDAAYDKANYIALRQGWTGFSLNDSTTNMQVMHKLRSLESVTDGDLIVTGDKFSKYSDLLGWFNFGSSNLATIDNNEGYMIYLENGPDTLRVTGTAPSTNDIQLKSGWNWIGFPFENPESLNAVLKLNAANSTGEDRIKIDFPLPGETAKFANYNIGGDHWNDGNMIDLEPNNLYKLYSGHPNGAILSWTPQNNMMEVPGKGTASRNFNAVADPNDGNTWIMPDFDTDEVMPVIAEVLVEGVLAVDPADLVAFFEDDTIRALGSITYINELLTWEVSLLAEKSISAYDIRYYDASEGIVQQASNVLGFGINGVGSLLDPYELLFTIDPCPNVMSLGLAGDPFGVDKTFEARQEIRVQGAMSIPAGVNIILSAPKVTIVDELDLGNNATITVRPDGCN